ncbi:AAA family ATPase [Tardiphaga sp.]|jgi:DNA polymerase III delta prime subunit|uniref:AAA family ATPase n=1 Tax=Tardiphaga sp. TaxID=1926292 RepID=UPI0037D9C02F
MSGSEFITDVLHPKRFEDLWGQEKAVKILSGLAIRKIPYSVLLHGAYGAGKTTLAGIYARALNCERLQSNGSPCLDCGQCNSLETNFLEIDVPNLPAKLDIAEYIRSKFRDLHDNVNRIVFLDEAHTLRTDHSDSLLKLIETRATTFILATTQPWSISAPLQSRLQSIEVLPLPFNEAIRFLHNAAKEIGISAEPEALRLIAAVAKGHPRDLLNRLDVFRDQGAGTLTEELVRQRFDVDSDQFLIDYFRCLCRLSDRLPPRILESWVATWQSKEAWVQALALSLYLRILRIDSYVDPIVDAIDDRRKDEILDAFRCRWRIDTLDKMIEPWRELLSIWDATNAIHSDTEIRLRFARFEHLVENVRSETRINLPEFDQLPSESDDIPRLFPLSDTFSSDAGYLEAAHARDIINRASAFAQQHAEWFNVSLLYIPPNEQRAETGTASASVSAFVQELLRFDDAGHSAQAAFSVLERDSEGVFGRIVAHLRGPAKSSQFGERLRYWLLETKHNTASLEIRSEFSTPEERCNFHWDSVADACSSLHHDSQPPRTLLKALRSPVREIGGPIFAPHFILKFYAALQFGSLERDQDVDMTFLSLISNEIWQKLREGWELNEHKIRQETHKKRLKELEALRQDFALDSERYSQELTQLRHKWKVSPSERLRSISGLIPHYV